MLLSWDIDEGCAGKAYDFITDHGQKKMDCKSPNDHNSKSLFVFFSDNLFSEFMKKFFLNETPKHPLNLGLD